MNVIALDSTLHEPDFLFKVITTQCEVEKLLHAALIDAPPEEFMNKGIRSGALLSILRESSLSFGLIAYISDR